MRALCAPAGSAALKPRDPRSSTPSSALNLFLGNDATSTHVLPWSQVTLQSTRALGWTRRFAAIRAESCFAASELEAKVGDENVRFMWGEAFIWRVWQLAGASGGGNGTTACAKAANDIATAEAATTLCFFSVSISSPLAGEIARAMGILGKPLVDNVFPCCGDIAVRRSISCAGRDAP